MVQSNPIVCSSIAGKIGGLGVLMHNKAYKEAGVNAVYVSFQPESAKGAIQAMKNLGFKGMGVTMPYKLEVIQYLDKLDDTAEKIGAVNTIVNNDGILTGYNTDWVGAIATLKQECDLKGKKVAMIGAGGVARAILYGLNKEEANVTIFNIFEDEAKHLCNEMGADFGGLPKDFNKNDNWDILINATSVGFDSTKTIFTSDQIPSDIIVLDVVFKPMETTFLSEAKKNNNIVIPGYKMLIYQAMAQDELYLSLKPKYEVMLEALKEKFKD
jgi:shikimate dehydrogenase